MQVRSMRSSRFVHLRLIALMAATTAGVLASPRAASAQFVFDVRHEVPAPGGTRSSAPLLLATDGNFYGSTSSSGRPRAASAKRIRRSSGRRAGSGRCCSRARITRRRLA